MKLLHNMMSSEDSTTISDHWAIFFGSFYSFIFVVAILPKNCLVFRVWRDVKSERRLEHILLQGQCVAFDLTHTTMR